MRRQGTADRCANRHRAGSGLICDPMRESMRRLHRRKLAALLALAAGTMQAAVIHGTVVENQTGHPLARATVTVQPVGSGSASQSVRTNAYGNFEVSALAAGTYLISATR